jgi:solute carrier family 34 (sodium-dependent phosphate cotransporter)
LSIDPDSGPAVPEDASSEPSSAAPDARPRWRAVLSKILHFAGALFLFILAIRLMVKGAGFIGPNLAESPLAANAVSTLGLGWLGAYVVLSGSPIAASAIALFDGKALTELQTFTMLSGSRLGASLVVLLVGFLYSVKSKDKRRTVGMGVLALSLTALVYVPGMLLGYGLLKAGSLSWVHWHASSELNSVIDLVWGPFVNFAVGLVDKGVIPGALLFPIGLGIILISFKLLDAVLPELDADKHSSARAQSFRRPWPMFGLGCLAALLTLSVSVALTILVPLAAKGHVTRREAIPYIMGANITTLADTLVVAMLAKSHVAAQIVLAEFIAVGLITIFYLAFFYRPISRGIIALDDWVVQTPIRLRVFVGCLFLTPVVVLGIGALIGQT